ncbi:MAG: ABC transporter substrate-binding protein, partial [Actinomycetota bacterium]|nr:ABC transporter substrate-binding protein [Actinomycetota bacterium]
MKKSWLKLVAPLFVIALIGAACGDSDSDSSTSSDTESSTETETTTAAPETEDTVLEAGTEAEGDVDTEVEEVVEESSYGGGVIIGLEAESTGLRPWEDACSSPCLVMMTSMIDRMVERRADGTYGPWLAKSWSPNDDYTAWTFELQEGVTFHNGNPFNAQTLVDMFELQKVGAVAAGVVSAAKVGEVVAVDELTVQYVLTGAHSAFPAFLYGVGLGGVFDPAAANEDFDGFSMNPVGTGPFMMESRDLDNETIVVRNPNYWMSDGDGNQLPYLDSISFRPIPDEGTRLDSLLSGTTSMMQTLRQGTIRDARAAKADGADIVLLEFQGNNVGGGQYNNNNPPLDDVRVRKGLTQMNNQDAVIEALGGTGISLPGTQWFSPDSPWYSEKVAAAWPKFDYDAGKALIEEYVNDPERSDGKAVGDNIEVELSCPPDPTLIAAIQVIEQLWSATGMVDVNVTNYDQQTHINYALGAPPDFMGEHG